MNRKLSTILLLAFLVAAFASYVVYRVADRQMHPVLAPATTQILVPARNLPIGTLIRDADLTTGKWLGPPPKGALVTKEAAIGRGVLSDLYEGEPILETRLAAAGSGGGLAATIRPGMRACAVRVDEVVGVAGFVRPGMHVDVLVSGVAPAAAAASGPRVRTLLQNIQVLSAGTDIQKDSDGKPVQVSVVNLLVTPEQAQLLSLASNQTRIQLVLRNPLDTDTPDITSVAIGSVFADSEPAPRPRSAEPVRKSVVPVEKAAPPAPPPAPRVFLIQVLNGGKHTEEKFSESRQQ
jgi:pilus assembly protein CpaB